ncbi:MAG: UbiH/UbiF family hydroxylase [Alsobacter sp.]
MPSASQTRVDIVVVGAGAAGLAAGIALAQAGWRTVVLGEAAARRDGRTVALMDGSVRILREIGAWPHLVGVASPLETLAIVDDTGSLFRAPPVSFHASEIGLDVFGENVESTALVDGLAAKARETDRLALLAPSMTGLDLRGDSVRLALSDGATLEAGLVVGADGRRSSVRDAAGITAREWSYEQVALTAIFAHDRPHRDTSTEFHTREGPFTLVPMQGRRSSLVWLVSPGHARRLQAMDDEAFARAVEAQAQSMLGAMRLAGPRGAVPMGGLSVDRFAADRIALVGEAAHVFPPIGAQGLNLGLRDVKALRDAVGEATGDPGEHRRLAAYDRARRFDVATRTATVDALNRSLLAGFLPVDIARGLGLMAISRIPPLRRFVMRQGLGAAL